jgi:general stress protein 26
MATRRQEIESLAKLMKKIDVAMLVTVGQGGYLVSRPLSTQTAQFDGERIWFMTEADSPKVAEIRRNGKVNVAYASKDASTYISAAGDAVVRRDQALIDAFWNDAMKAFFPKGKDDPNLTLIEVAVRTIEYWDGPGTWLGKAATFLVARITGNDDVMGENRIVDVATGRSVKPPGTDRPGTRKPPNPAKSAKSAAKKAVAKKTSAAKATKSAPAKTATKATAATRKSAASAQARKAPRKTATRTSASR